jgi:hypothetical protein
VPAALSSAFYRALGKEDFAERRTRQSPALGKELIYQVHDTRHNQALGKDGSRQRAVSGRLQLTAVSLCRASNIWHSAKKVFAELGKAYFYFFNFGYQTFCGMFLHYVDLHVPFWDNYNSVFYN